MNICEVKVTRARPEPFKWTSVLVVLWKTNFHPCPFSSKSGASFPKGQGPHSHHPWQVGSSTNKSSWMIRRQEKMEVSFFCLEFMIFHFESLNKKSLLGKYMHLGFVSSFCTILYFFRPFRSERSCVFHRKTIEKPMESIGKPPKKPLKNRGTTTKRPWPRNPSRRSELPTFRPISADWATGLGLGHYQETQRCHAFWRLFAT